MTKNLLFQFQFNDEFVQIPCGYVPDGYKGTKVRRITISTMAFIQSNNKHYKYITL